MLRFLPPPAVALMTAQHGVATAAQLRSTGLGARTLGTAVQRRLLLCPYRGIYVCAATWAEVPRHTRHAMLVLGIQLGAPDTVAAGRTAPTLWRLPVRRTPDRPTVIRAPGRGLLTGVDVIRTRLHPHDIANQDQLTMTTLARCAVDSALGETLPDALITVDAVLRRGLSRTLLQSQIDACRFASERDCAQKVIDLGDPWSESWLESLSRGRGIERCMPIPLCNVILRAHGRAARVDDLWPELGVVGECDGKVKYDDPKTGESVIWNEKRRHEWLEEIGFEVARWGMREVAGSGAAMEARFRRAVARQARAGTGWPPGVTAGIRLLSGVTPPPRVTFEVERLRRLGYPINWEHPDDLLDPRQVPRLWTP